MSDLIIHPDGRIQDHWRREHGHNLLSNDISELLDATPEKLVIGTGASGMMKVSESLVECCKNRGIDVEICCTAKAVTSFNEAVEAGKIIAACFHLTC